MPNPTFEEIAPHTVVVTQLNYEQISQPLPRGKYGYTDRTYFAREDQTSVWINFTQLGSDTPNETGWKLHIGIDDTDMDNLRAGWNTIIPILKEYGVVQFKVVQPGKKLSSVDAEQCGKQITIYCFNQTHQKIPNSVLYNIHHKYVPKGYWDNLMIDITHHLINMKIKPAPLPPGDLPIQGTPYISYRNDSGENGEYTRMSHHQEATDPFKNIRVLAYNISGIERPAFPVTPLLSHVFMK